MGRILADAVFRRNFALAFCLLGHWERRIAELEDVIKADPEDVKAARALYIVLENARAARKARASEEPKRLPA
jgi:hypothetical protein